MSKIVRTDAKNSDFLRLISELDAYLRITDGDDHEFYNQFNTLEKINNVVIAYQDAKPIGCGAFRAIDTNTVEIKRMFVKKKYRGTKRKMDTPTGNTNEVAEPADEALNMQQRRARARQMKKYQARLKVGRKKARMKVANQKVLARRARKAARLAIAKKLTKGIPKSELTPARKQEIEKRIDKMGPRVTRLAKKMLPKLRQAEIGKKRG